MKPYDTFFTNMLVMIEAAMESESKATPVYTGNVDVEDRQTDYVRHDRYLTGRNRIVS